MAVGNHGAQRVSTTLVQANEGGTHSAPIKGRTDEEAEIIVPVPSGGERKIPPSSSFSSLASLSAPCSPLIKLTLVRWARNYYNWIEQFGGNVSSAKTIHERRRYGLVNVSEIISRSGLDNSPLHNQWRQSTPPPTRPSRQIFKWVTLLQITQENYTTR